MFTCEWKKLCVLSFYNISGWVNDILCSFIGFNLKSVYVWKMKKKIFQFTQLLFFYIKVH